MNPSARRTSFVVAAVLTAGIAVAALPEPDHVFYGPAPEGPGEIVVTLGADTVPVARYVLGSRGDGHYLLRIPMDSIGARSSGAARSGDEVVFSLNGAPIASSVIGERGGVSFLDLSNPGAREGITIEDAAVREGDGGVAEAVFRLTLEKARAHEVVVQYAIADGTAELGEDYASPDAAPARRTRGARRAGTQEVARVQSVTIAPRTRSATIAVPVLGDTEAEADETFFVRLRSARGAPIARRQAQGTILDDDDPGSPSLAVEGARVQEGSDGSRARVVVRLSRAHDRQVAVAWGTTTGAAVAGADFVPASGTLTFAPGETERVIEVAILDDGDAEPDEGFVVALSAPVNSVIGTGEASVTIVDDDGGDGFEVGRVEIGAAATSVRFVHAFDDPVVILGPAIAPVVTVGQAGFDIGRRSMRGGDDGLRDEVSYLVLDRGIHVLPDGSVWQAGTIEIAADGTWIPVAFDRPFAGPPAVLLAVQRGPEGRPAIARARRVGAEGFEAASFEIPAVAETGRAVVGYVAVHTPDGGGTIATDTGTRPFLAQTTEVGRGGTPVLGWRLSTEPDVDLGVPAPVAALAVGDHLFAQIVGGEPAGPVALRVRSPEPGALLEWGTAASIGERWTTIPLARRHARPVVVAKPVHGTGSTPFDVRVRDVTETSFAVRCEPWHAGGTCSDVRVAYLVAEEGRGRMSGLEIRAGILETARRIGDGWLTVNHDLPLHGAPAVFAGLQTDANPAVRARVHDRSAEGFLVALETRREVSGPLAPETVGWIALENGVAETETGRRVEVRAARLGQASASIDPGARVTLVDAGSAYFAEPSLVGFSLDAEGIAGAFVLVVGDAAMGRAEEVCVLTAE